MPGNHRCFRRPQIRLKTTQPRSHAATLAALAALSNFIALTVYLCGKELVETQEQVNEKAVAVSITAMKLTGKTLAKALSALARKLNEDGAAIGKQSVMNLARKGAQLQNIEISDGNIKCFEHTARKYGISFALKRDAAATPPKHIVFFKAKDIDAMTLAFTEFSRRALKQSKDKPSVLEKLADFKDKSKGIAPPAKNRALGGHEL